MSVVYIDAPYKTGFSESKEGVQNILKVATDIFMTIKHIVNEHHAEM